MKTVQPANPSGPSLSRWSGTKISELLGADLPGHFEDDRWDLGNHPDMASGSKRNVNFDLHPTWMRDILKEFFVLAARPDLHGDLAPEVIGLKRKDLKTIVRWLSGLAVDLAWLNERCNGLALVQQDDYSAWACESGLSATYRRIGGLKAFVQYAPAMSPTLDRLTAEPWPGSSALKVGGGKKALRRVNSTLPIGMENLAPLLLAAMFLVENGSRIVEAVRATRSGQIAGEVEVRDADGNVRLWQPRHDWNDIARQVAASCVFVTATFTGMRASELDAIPREDPLDAISISGARRWLITSYLTKGLIRPRREQWLVPPIVATAVEVVSDLLIVLDVPADTAFSPTGLAPLFDRRLFVRLQRKKSVRAAIRLERVVEAVVAASDHLSRDGFTPSLPDGMTTINGRALRRTFTRIVGSREHGPQAAMEQFKWQQPETAAGYFRMAPDQVSLAQREIYNEIALVHQDQVVDAMVSEFEVWERLVEAGQHPGTPAGPDGRRKRDTFESVRAALEREPRVEEDDRRLRLLLRHHAGGITLTELGWCDWDAEYALCGSEDGPIQARCQPHRCMNHSVPAASIAAHQVKRKRLIELTRDRRMPALARDQARENAKAIEDDLGELLGE